MADPRKPEKKEKGLGDEVAEGLVGISHPGYAAYKREAIAMGDKVLTPEQWAAQQDRDRDSE